MLAPIMPPPTIAARAVGGRSSPADMKAAALRLRSVSRSIRASCQTPRGGGPRSTGNHRLGGSGARRYLVITLVAIIFELPVIGVILVTVPLGARITRLLLDCVKSN